MHSNIHLRGVDKTLLHQLKEKAQAEHISVNSLILDLLNSSLGLKPGRHTTTYHDLDALAGTWSKQKARAFLKYTADFETIDEELWK